MVWRGCWVRARGNYERCRDLVQEVSIALWLHLDQLRTDVSPKEEQAWVWWMTRTTLDHLHRSQRPPMVALTEMMATARCNDHCMLTIGMQDHSYSPTTTSGTNAFWVQVGDRPRQQVFIKQLPRGNPTQPIPASTQRILMF